MKIHPHAQDRMNERGATEEEVNATIGNGECFPAKFGRQGFRRNFSFDGEWRGRHYTTKQVEVIATCEEDDWLAISVIVKYF
jgi:hypothetical protein